MTCYNFKWIKMSENRYSGSVIVALDGCVVVIIMVAAGAFLAKKGVRKT